MSATLTLTTEASASTSTSASAPNASSHGYQMVQEQGAHNLAMGGNPFPIPEFTDLYAKRRWMLEHLAGQFRIWSRKDYTEGTAGHITIRDPIDPNTFWINPLGLHFGLIKASDLVHVDMAGNIIGGSRKPVNQAGFLIHAAVYKARPKVNAAAHCHSIYGKAYSAFGKPLEMINQDACIFYKDHSVYEDFGGLVLEGEEGDHIAAALGPNKACILRNHGLLTVGETVDEAGYLFTLMERTCQAQLLVDAARRQGHEPLIAPDADAMYTYQASSDPESLYVEAQPDYEYEVAMAKGEFLDLPAEHQYTGL